VYLAAQHVRSSEGAEGVHTFLHLHDTVADRFPSDPLTVPQDHPGRLVARHTEIPMGMNSVLSYLDVIALDEVWRDRPLDYWRNALASLGELMKGEPLPWVVEASDAHLIFSAVPTVEVEGEFDTLLAAALLLSRDLG
jgi:hypothetical protein